MDLIINGQKFSKDESINIINPFSNEIVDSVPKVDLHDIDTALNGALKGFKQQKSLSSGKRSDYLFKTADLIDKHQEELSHLLTHETGKRLKESKIEIKRTISVFQLAAEEGKRIAGEYLPMDYQGQGENKMAFYKMIPLGIITAITPFNLPVVLAAHKIAPAIAAGNSVIVKPSLLAPLTIIKVIHLMLESGLPPHIVSVVCGDDQIIGKPLIKDNRIKMISFTGSRAVGEMIIREAGIKPVSLELGSTTALIVCENSRWQEACENAAKAAYANAGQVCISLQRIFVHKSLYEPFLNQLKNIVEQLRVGNPLNPDTDVSVMINEKAALKVKSFIENAINQGAKLETGGDINKNIVQPTILSNVSTDMLIMQEEVFGPVVCIMPFDHLEQAVEMTNKSDYALNAAIYANDISDIMFGIENIESGSVIVNSSPIFRVDNMPFGGVKKSGFSREGVRFAMEAMTEKKLIVIKKG